MFKYVNGLTYISGFMQSVSVFGDLSNVFNLISSNLQDSLNSIATRFMLDKKKSYKSRVAARKAFIKMEEISEKYSSKISNKLDKLSSKEIGVYNEKDIVNDFKSIFNSVEFNELKKEVSGIPANQQVSFLKEVFVKVEGKLVETRSYLNNYIMESKKQQNIKKLNVLDQSIYLLVILNREMKKEITRKKQTKTAALLSDYIILSIKINAFMKNKIDEKELYKTMANVDSDIKLEDKLEVKQYLSALTN